MGSTVISRVKELLGDANVVDSTQEMQPHLQGKGVPLAVVFPSTTSEVANVVKLGNELGVKISVGGRIVSTKGLDGGIAMVLSRMNRLLEIDHENLVATVEPGMLHRELQERVAEEGLYFPPEPLNISSSSIGGCFAIGDLDDKAFNYGPPRAYILGFEMVLPTGEVMHIGSKAIKNVAGYDMIHFVVGSRGTLGVLTKLLIKLLPQPEIRRTVLGGFPSLSKACAAIGDVVGRKIYPARFNLVNGPIAQNIASGQGGNGSPFMLMVELEGFGPSTTHLSEEITSIFTLNSATDVNLVSETSQQSGLWDSWLSIKEQQLGKGAAQSFDVMVGPAHLRQALADIEGILGDPASDPLLTAYCLNGNIRIVFPLSSRVDLESTLGKINDVALAYGGNIAGELGFRLKCLKNNEEELWQEVIALENTIRMQFDPNGILAPGEQNSQGRERLC